MHDDDPYILVNGNRHHDLKPKMKCAEIAALRGFGPEAKVTRVAGRNTAAEWPKGKTSEPCEGVVSVKSGDRFEVVKA